MSVSPESFPGNGQRDSTPTCDPVLPESTESRAKPTSKILPFDELVPISRQRGEGEVLVHAHGVFDLLHIGHIRHLERARSLGDRLVVTVTPDSFVNKGPDRPVFNDQLRAEAIAALDCVDHVAVNLWATAEETIHALKPDVYAKGSEYRSAEQDVTGGIALERSAVESAGGRLEFTDEITFSSSTLLNRHTDAFPSETRDYLTDFSLRYDAAEVVQWLDRVQSLRVAVVGEAIIDEYQYCDAIGKSSKEPMLAVRPYSVERFAGGTLAVANHIASFARSVDLISVVGSPEAEHQGAGAAHQEFIGSELQGKITRRLVARPDGPTIVKRRFIDRYFFHKLLAVYEMNDAPIHGRTEELFLAQLDDCLAEVDLVIVVDFGHGAITDRAIERIVADAPLLAVNVQSNAGNQGLHTVSRWPRADFVTLTENEARLETRDSHGPIEPQLQIIAERIGCDRLVVTQGSRGCLCREADESIRQVPAVATRVRDRMGAGDTFLSLSALCVAAGAPLEIAALVGSAASAHAVATVGHRRSVERLGLIRHLQCLLK